MRKWLIAGLILVIIVAGGIFTLQPSRPIQNPATATITGTLLDSTGTPQVGNDTGDGDPGARGAVPAK